MTYERARLKAMQGYTPGQQPDRPAIKLNTNENPYPPGPAVAHALSSFPLNMLQRYPDPLAGAFRASVARLHRLAPANVIATNGGDELLRLALTTFLDPGKPLGLLTPSYSLYSILATIHGSPLATVPLGNDWSVPDNTAERWNAAGVPLAIMTNPHAPSGTLVSAAGLHKLALTFRGVLLVDEAYVDFVDPEIGHETSTMVAAYPNVLLLRTLSKGYSLTGGLPTASELLNLSLLCCRRRRIPTTSTPSHKPLGQPRSKTSDPRPEVGRRCAVSGELLIWP